jgi:alpha-glucosidase
LVSGDITLLDTPEDIVAFIRQQGENTVLCAFNLGDAPCVWSPPADWQNARLLATQSAVGDGGAMPDMLAPGTGYWAAMTGE